VHTPAVVGELDNAEAVEQVLRLDIPMNDVLRVNVLQGLTYLENVAGRFLLRVMALRLRFQVLVQLALGAVLEDQIDLVIIEEESVELHHILVAQVAVNLHLSPQLMGYLRIQQLVLVEHFKRDDEFCLLLPRKVDVAKLSTPKGLSDLEIVD